MARQLGNEARVKMSPAVNQAFSEPVPATLGKSNLASNGSARSCQHSRCAQVRWLLGEP